MSVWIAQLDSNGSLVPPPGAVGMGMDPAAVATMLGWGVEGVGWRIITDQEAADLMSPPDSDSYFAERADVESMYSELAKQTQTTWTSALNENPQPTLKIQELLRSYKALQQDMHTAAVAVDQKYSVDTTPMEVSTTACPLCAIPMYSRTVFGVDVYFCSKCGSQHVQSEFLVPPAGVVTPDTLEEDLHVAVRMHLDSFARESNYDDIAAARQAALTDKFKADGAIANAAYESTWDYILSENVIDSVRAGTMSVDSAITSLPVISWDTSVITPSSNYTVSGGTGAAYSAVIPAFNFDDAIPVYIRWHTPNVANCTLAINVDNPKPIRLFSEGVGLLDNTLQAGYVSTLVYDATADAFILTSAFDPGLPAIAATLQSHRDHDMIRWQEFYDFKNQVLDLKAGIEGKVLDLTATVDIEAAAQTATGYVVTNALGGRVAFTDTIVLLDLIPGQVSVNGKLVWSGQALGIGAVSDWVDVNDTDVVTCLGITGITFTPYIPKPAA